MISKVVKKNFLWNQNLSHFNLRYFGFSISPIFNSSKSTMYDPNSCPTTPDRPISAATRSKRNLSNNDMKELLQCPVCLDIPLPPIHTCRKGHIVCNSCQESTIICPLCESGFSYTRSYVAEGIFEKCIMPCKFAEDGCKRELHGDHLIKHLRKCQFKPIRCSYCGGNWIDYSRYLKHLENSHDLNSADKSSGFCTINMASLAQGDKEQFICPPHSFHTFGQVFLFSGIGDNDFLCTYVSLFGLKEDAPKYNVSMDLVITETKPKMQLCWKGSAIPFRKDPFGHVFAYGCGLLVPLNVIKRNAIHFLHIHVNIEQKE